MDVTCAGEMSVPHSFLVKSFYTLSSRTFMQTCLCPIVTVTRVRTGFRLIIVWLLSVKVEWSVGGFSSTVSSSRLPRLTMTSSPPSVSINNVGSRLSSVILRCNSKPFLRSNDRPAVHGEGPGRLSEGLHQSRGGQTGAGQKVRELLFHRPQPVFYL